MSRELPSLFVKAFAKNPNAVENLIELENICREVVHQAAKTYSRHNHDSLREQEAMRVSAGNSLMRSSQQIEALTCQAMSAVDIHENQRGLMYWGFEPELPGFIPEAVLSAPCFDVAAASENTEALADVQQTASVDKHASDSGYGGDQESQSFPWHELDESDQF